MSFSIRMGSNKSIFYLKYKQKNIFRQPKYDDFPPSVARQFTSELSTSQCYASCSAKSIPLMGLSIKMSVSTLIQIAVCLLLLPWPVLILHEMLVKHSTPWYTRWWVIVSQRVWVDLQWHWIRPSLPTDQWCYFLIYWMNENVMDFHFFNAYINIFEIMNRVSVLVECTYSTLSDTHQN